MWHGAEALGNVIGAQQQLAGSGKRSGASGAAAAAGAQLTREQAIAAIKADYSQNYFVSGGTFLKVNSPCLGCHRCVAH